MTTAYSRSRSQARYLLSRPAHTCYSSFALQHLCAAEVGVYLDCLRDYTVTQGIALKYNKSIGPRVGHGIRATIRILSGQTETEDF